MFLSRILFKIIVLIFHRYTTLGQLLTANKLLQELVAMIPEVGNIVDGNI
jgi:hypothetical protein